MQTIYSAALLLVLAQQAPPQPTFKTGVNLVEVDVVVTDKTGRPVPGLRQDDFEVSEDGKPVSIATFVAVDLPQAPPDETVPLPDLSGVSIATNTQREDGRVLLIVLDDYHVRFAGGHIVRAKAIARRLVERLGPSDQAAVIATSGQRVAQAEFTGDKARLIAAIEKFFPQSERSASGAEVDRLQQPAGRSGGGGFTFVEEIKARWAMEALSNAAAALAQIPNRRKAILLVSEGLPASVEQLVTSQNASAAFQALRDFVLTAQRSNVAVYPIDPCGLGTDCSTDAQQNLRTLAEHTGGFAVVNTNAPEASVERIVAENGTYYLIGYASPAAVNDGRRHRIRVRTRVPGVEVRAREGYWAPSRAAKPVVAPPLDQLIAAPIQTRGLTMRLAAVPAPLASSPGATVVVAMDVAARDALAAGTIDVSLVAVDADGRIRGRQRFSNTFEASGGSTAGWARLRSHLPLAPGRYQIRVAAVGANKQHGSVFTEVVVPKFDTDVAAGGLTLVSPAPGAPAQAKHMAGAPALAPLTVAELPAGVPVVAHMPVRISKKAAAGPLTITATLTRPDGTTQKVDSATPAAAEYAAASGAIYRLALPSPLAPGAYRIAVEVAAQRSSVRRELAFRILAAQ